MKNLLYILLLSLTSIVVVISACKKDKVEPEPCTDCQSVLEAKEYFAFKVGSWWVYEEETSLARDSVYVTESMIDQSWYDFDIKVYSTYQDYYYHFSPTYMDKINGCKTHGLVSKKCLYVTKSKTKPGNFVGADYCLFFTHKVNDFIYISNVAVDNDKLIIENVFDSYELSNFDYGNTVKVHELNTFYEGKQPTNHYYSKGVGLIRKELLDSNEVWNLVNYHIEP